MSDVSESETPALGYAGTSGFSGGATSEERARREDSDGTTGKRQREALMWLRNRRHYGMTWKEFSRLTTFHHGQASGALSNLHKAGLIARLTERRDRCFVYVMPEHVEGRETQGHGTRNKRVLTDTEQGHVDWCRTESDLGYDFRPHEVEQLLAIIDRLTKD